MTQSREDAERARVERVALRMELARQRVDHARAVRRVVELESTPPRGLLAAAEAMVVAFGSPSPGYAALLAMARVRRDTAHVAIRALECRLGTVDVNDA